MNGYEFRNALKGGKCVYGMMLATRSPKYAPVIAGLGMDYIFIDTEHTDVDRTTLSWMCRAYSALNVAPIVRIPSPDPYTASTVLDGGAEGVIAPYVESVGEVKALVGAVKYKPLKGERLKNFLDGTEKLEPVLEAYLDNANRSRSVIVNIESIPAMKALDDILRVPGLDGILIGPHDLSCSLGIPEQYTHPAYEAAVREILSKARKAGVGAGIHVHYAGDIAREITFYRDTGANFVVHKSDILTFALTMKKELAELREGIEGKTEKAGETRINI